MQRSPRRGTSIYSLAKSLKGHCKMIPGCLKASAIANGIRLANRVLRIHRTWSSSSVTEHVRSVCERSVRSPNAPVRSPNAPVRSANAPVRSANAPVRSAKAPVWSPNASFGLRTRPFCHRTQHRTRPFGHRTQRSVTERRMVWGAQGWITMQWASYYNNIGLANCWKVGDGGTSYAYV